MFFLGIESSCDETAACVIEKREDSWRILSEEISSQVKLHEAYGGVVPELASREHLANLPIIVDKVMKEAGLDYKALTAIGVTRGPGLKGCLLMGTTFAKALSWGTGVSLVGVNHIEAHIHAAALDDPGLKMPFLALVVSGGHTEIVEVRGLGDYRIHARTSDDAAGEAFDKSANLLGFPYPGGAKLAALADSHGKSSFRLPRVMREAQGFSFSGLKTAIASLIRQNKDALENTPTTRGDICAAVQEAIIDALCFKLNEAIQATGIKRVCVAGGVSANKALREKISAIRGTQTFFPNLNHCMDNAAMVAYLAALRYLKGQKDEYDFAVLSRWPVEEAILPCLAYDECNGGKVQETQNGVE